MWVCFFFYLRPPSEWVHFKTSNTHIQAFILELPPPPPKTPPVLCYSWPDTSNPLEVCRGVGGVRGVQGGRGVRGECLIPTYPNV